MKKTVILNDNQVKRLQQTGTVAVVELVKHSKTVEEPMFGYTCFTPPNHISLRGYFNWDENVIKQRRYGEKFIKLPYQPGSTLYVRERWGELGEELFVWSEVDKYKNGNLDLSYINWQSPATMPKSAARLFPIVASVECVRVKEVGTEQQYKLGFRCGCCDALGCGECSNIMDYSYEIYIINRFGLSAWDNNAFIFITTFKIEK